MTLQLTILGLGQIGASVGMALAKYNDQILRVGHDKSRDAINFAKEHDAVDKIALTLSGSVEHADIILLALPFQEIFPVLKHIAQDLKEDALIIDTSPLKQPVIQWVEELLPEGRNYIGFTPVISCAYLDEFGFGPEVAHEDLFKGSLMGIVTGRAASEKAVNMAANLVQLLGATPYFCDPAEMDGLMTLTYLMPGILAASLLKSSLDSPGWREARKIAGKAYSQVTNSLGQDQAPGALAAAILNNQENFTRVINDVIQSLISIRDFAVSDDPAELEDTFTSLQQGRDLWMADRRESRWIEVPNIELPKGGVMAHLLGFRGPKPPKEEQ